MLYGLWKHGESWTDSWKTWWAVKCRSSDTPHRSVIFHQPLLSLCQKKSEILFLALSKWGTLNLRVTGSRVLCGKLMRKVYLRCQVIFLQNGSLDPYFIIWRQASMKSRRYCPGFSTRRYAAHSSKSKCHLSLEAFLEACQFGADFSVAAPKPSLPPWPLSAGCTALQPSTAASTKAPDGLTTPRMLMDLLSTFFILLFDDLLLYVPAFSLDYQPSSGQWPYLTLWVTLTVSVHLKPCRGECWKFNECRISNKTVQCSVLSWLRMLTLDFKNVNGVLYLTQQ